MIGPGAGTIELMLAASRSRELPSDRLLDPARLRD